MRTILMACVALIVLLPAPALAQGSPDPPPPPGELGLASKAAGWKLLFDGHSTKAWRAYHGQTFPDKGWLIEDGCLKTVPGGGDIITVDEYGDFELELEWRVAEKANSGIMYRVTEKHDAAWQTGPEYQVIDDQGNGIAPTAGNAVGALYELYPPPADKVVKPVGQFNQTRIRLKDNLLQHWLNDVKVVECRWGSDEWKERIGRSKFHEFEGFGAQPQGHIALQNYGNEVWFRNIRIRNLSAPLPGEVRLFNGRDLAGWTACLPEGARMADVWSVADGVLICKGQPIGYLRTEADYTNYVLKLEWRFNPVTKQAGNSGVLLRIIGPDKVWPRCIEAQLESGNAADFWNIDEFPMKTDPARTQGRNTKKTHGAEQPVGEWNEYEIIVEHSKVMLKVNGELLNHAWDVQETPGKIGLQSEGAEIQFRNIRLAPLP
jgi:hypothetical protein